MNAYDKALSLLAIREYSSKELERKLIDKGFGKEEVENSIASLKKNNFLSDERYALSYINSRMRKTPEGEYIIYIRLREKGVENDLARLITHSFFENGEHIPYLSKALDKSIRIRGKEKSILFFERKGFSLKDINTCLN